MPFSNKPQTVVYELFIDYATGEIKQGSHYFKPLGRTIIQYVDHLEHKFDSDIGILDRKHVHADSIVCIGKEANNIDMQELEGNRVESYLNIEKFNEWLLCLTLDDVWEMGIEHRSTLKQLKDRVREGEF